MREILIYSLKRSGHHAIINWLCSQNKPSIHFNKCSYNKKDQKIMSGSYTIYSEKRSSVKTEIMPDLNNYKLVFYSFEDMEMIPIGNERIFIIREPKNWIASRLSADRFLKNPAQTVSLWKRFATSDEFLILYDKWFVSEKYRKYICNKLKLNFSDEGLNDVFRQGSSSFDGYKYDGKAQKMDVLNRWKKYKDDENMKNFSQQIQNIWTDLYDKLDRFV